MASIRVISGLSLFDLTFLLFITIYAQNGDDEYFDDAYLRNSDYIYKDNIKSALLYKEGFEMASPIVRLNSDDRLIFSFDDLGGDYEKYEYRGIYFGCESKDCW